MWLCSLCGKPFQHCLRRLQHRRVHSTHRPYICHVGHCTKLFSTLSEYQIHQRRHTDHRPHRCRICHVKFLTRQHLKHHRCDAGGHHCQKCLQLFPSLFALRSHLKIKHWAKQGVSKLELRRVKIKYKDKCSVIRENGIGTSKTKCGRDSSCDRDENKILLKITAGKSTTIISPKRDFHKRSDKQKKKSKKKQKKSEKEKRNGIILSIKKGSVNLQNSKKPDVYKRVNGLPSYLPKPVKLKIKTYPCIAVEQTNESKTISSEVSNITGLQNKHMIVHSESLIQEGGNTPNRKHFEDMTQVLNTGESKVRNGIVILKDKSGRFQAEQLQTVKLRKRDHDNVFDSLNDLQWKVMPSPRTDNPSDVLKLRLSPQKPLRLDSGLDASFESASARYLDVALKTKLYNSGDDSDVFDAGSVIDKDLEIGGAGVNDSGIEVLSSSTVRSNGNSVRSVILDESSPNYLNTEDSLLSLDSPVAEALSKSEHMLCHKCGGIVIETNNNTRSPGRCRCNVSNPNSPFQTPVSPMKTNTQSTDANEKYDLEDKKKSASPGQRKDIEKLTTHCLNEETSDTLKSKTEDSRSESDESDDIRMISLNCDKKLSSDESEEENRSLRLKIQLGSNPSASPVKKVSGNKSARKLSPRKRAKTQSPEHHTTEDEQKADKLTKNSNKLSAKKTNQGGDSSRALGLDIVSVIDDEEDITEEEMSIDEGRENVSKKLFSMSRTRSHDSSSDHSSNSANLEFLKCESMEFSSINHEVEKYENENNFSGETNLQETVTEICHTSKPLPEGNRTETPAFKNTDLISQPEKMTSKPSSAGSSPETPAMKNTDLMSQPEKMTSEPTLAGDGPETPAMMNTDLMSQHEKMTSKPSLAGDGPETPAMKNTDLISQPEKITSKPSLAGDGPDTPAVKNIDLISQPEKMTSKPSSANDSPKTSAMEIADLISQPEQSDVKAHQKATKKKPLFKSHKASLNKVSNDSESAIAKVDDDSTVTKKSDLSSSKEQGNKSKYKKPLFKTRTVSVDEDQSLRKTKKPLFKRAMSTVDKSKTSVDKLENKLCDKTSSRLHVDIDKLLPVSSPEIERNVKDLSKSSQIHAVKNEKVRPNSAIDTIEPSNGRDSSHISNLQKSLATEPPLDTEKEVNLVLQGAGDEVSIQTADMTRTCLITENEDSLQEVPKVIEEETLPVSPPPLHKAVATALNPFQQQFLSFLTGTKMPDGKDKPEGKGKDTKPVKKAKKKPVEKEKICNKKVSSETSSGKPDIEKICNKKVSSETSSGKPDKEKIGNKKVSSEASSGKPDKEKKKKTLSAPDDGKLPVSDKGQLPIPNKVQLTAPDKSQISAPDEGQPVPVEEPPPAPDEGPPPALDEGLPHAPDEGSPPAPGEDQKDQNGTFSWLNIFSQNAEQSEAEKDAQPEKDTKPEIKDELADIVDLAALNQKMDTREDDDTDSFDDMFESKNSAASRPCRTRRASRRNSHAKERRTVCKRKRRDDTDSDISNNSSDGDTIDMYCCHKKHDPDFNPYMDSDDDFMPAKPFKRRASIGRRSKRSQSIESQSSDGDFKLKLDRRSEDRSETSSQTSRSRRSKQGQKSCCPCCLGSFRDIEEEEDHFSRRPSYKLPRNYKQFVRSTVRLMQLQEKIHHLFISLFPGCIELISRVKVGTEEFDMLIEDVLYGLECQDVPFEPMVNSSELPATQGVMCQLGESSTARTIKEGVAEYGILNDKGRTDSVTIEKHIADHPLKSCLTDLNNQKSLENSVSDKVISGSHEHGLLNSGQSVVAEDANSDKCIKSSTAEDINGICSVSDDHSADRVESRAVDQIVTKDDHSQDLHVPSTSIDSQLPVFPLHDNAFADTASSCADQDIEQMDHNNFDCAFDSVDSFVDAEVPSHLQITIDLSAARVSVCREPKNCLQRLQGQLVKLVKYLLPDLDLKNYFFRNINNLEFLVDLLIQSNSTDMHEEMECTSETDHDQTKSSPKVDSECDLKVEKLVPEAHIEKPVTVAPVEKPVESITEDTGEEIPFELRIKSQRESLKKDVFEFEEDDTAAMIKKSESVLSNIESLSKIAKRNVRTKSRDSRLRKRTAEEKRTLFVQEKVQNYQNSTIVYHSKKRTESPQKSKTKVNTKQRFLSELNLGDKQEVVNSSEVQEETADSEKTVDETNSDAKQDLDDLDAESRRKSGDKNIFELMQPSQAAETSS